MRKKKKKKKFLAFINCMGFFLVEKNCMGLNDYTGSVYIHMYNGYIVSTVKFAYNEIVNISNPCEPPFFNWYVSLWIFF